jgi:hypothetical protein
MNTKWMLAGLAAVALGVALMGVTGCGKSESNHAMTMPDTGANASVSTNTPAPAPDTNTGAATTPANTNTVSEIKAAALQYTCEMHPEVVQDAPGRCPKCGMKLAVKK